MWSAVHHMDRDARGRTKSVIDLMEMDKIMRELPSDMRFLKKLVARLLCTNLEMSIRCKVWGYYPK